MGYSVCGMILAGERLAETYQDLDRLGLRLLIINTVMFISCHVISNGTVFPHVFCTYILSFFEFVLGLGSGIDSDLIFWFLGLESPFCTYISCVCVCFGWMSGWDYDLGTMNKICMGFGWRSCS